MSNCYLSVNMPSALFQELYAKYYGLYAKLRMLDCNMPKAMTIAISFSMTTEQVGHIIIYIYYPAMTLHIAVTRRNYYYTTRASVYISGLRYISLLAHQVIKWYLESQVFQYANISWQEQSLSMPTYHGKSKVSVCQHIMARAKFQYASISWHRPKSPITVYFGLPAYQGIYQ
jgi:hypothetical protein